MLIYDFMTSKVEGMEKLKRFHFKLKERLNFELSYSVLHGWLQEQKMWKQWKTKKKCTYEMI